MLISSKLPPKLPQIITYTSVPETGPLLKPIMAPGRIPSHTRAPTQHLRSTRIAASRLQKQTSPTKPKVSPSRIQKQSSGLKQESPDPESKDDVVPATRNQGSITRKFTTLLARINEFVEGDIWNHYDALDFTKVTVDRLVDEAACVTKLVYAAKESEMWQHRLIGVCMERANKALDWIEEGVKEYLGVCNVVGSDDGRREEMEGGAEDVVDKTVRTEGEGVAAQAGLEALRTKMLTGFWYLRLPIRSLRGMVGEKVRRRPVTRRARGRKMQGLGRTVIEKEEID